MLECWFTKILVVLVTVLSSPVGESKAYPIAKEGCPDECGGVPIPFPFGIGDACFFNTTEDAFRIDCDNNTNPPVPYIGSGVTKLELLSIDVEANILSVPQGVAYECYHNGKRVAHNTTAYNISLSGMEMQLSYNNEYVAVGCDTFAWLLSDDYYNYYGDYYNQLQPICNTSCIDLKAARNDTCDRLHGCCQASRLVDYIKAVHQLKVNGSSRKNEGCHYAFISEIGWFSFSTHNLTATAADCDQIRVPVVYDWYLPNDDNLTCGSYATTSSGRCNCLEGYRGNPYLLPQGCDQDINECAEEGLNYCEKPEHCVNKFGGYDCRCPEGHHGNGTITSPCVDGGGEVEIQGCPVECGGVKIPFPFGIGNGCFLNFYDTEDAFRIECDNSTNPPVPYIGSGITKLEVLSIDVEASTLRASHGVSYECYHNGKRVAHNTTAYNISLSGMEMQLSSTKNEFVAVGCDTFASLLSDLYYNYYDDYYSQLQPICNTSCIDLKGARNGTCDPLYGCCHASLTDIHMYEDQQLNVNGSYRQRQGCHYAFISEIGWFNFSTPNLTATPADCDQIRVPVVYHWNLPTDDNLKCGSYTNNTSSGICECLEGYKGNPYLPQGCDQDINECVEDGLNDCEKPELCVNKFGGYDCRCPEGHHGNGTITSPCIPFDGGRDVAIQGCPVECNGVKIPFPFGIGHGCYGKSDFEIKCDDSNSTNPKPILPYLGHREVLNINIEDQTLRLSNEVAYQCYKDGQPLPSPTINNHFNLDNLAPFTISTTRNKLVAIGCVAIARLTSGVEGDVSCGTSCVDMQDVITCESASGCCAASGCCEAPISRSPSRTSITVEHMSNNNTLNSSCIYAFVGEVGSYKFSATPNLTILPNDFGNIRVPIIYDWYISTLNISCSEAKMERNDSSNVPVTLCHSNARIECIDEDGYGYHCQCLEGYDGNPYLQPGCQDINECLVEKLNDCQRPGFCLNNDGGYHCKCPDGHHGNGTTISPCIPSPVVGRDNLVLGLSIGMGSIISLILLYALYKLLKRRKDVKERQHNFKKNGGLLLQQEISANEGAIDRTKIFTRNELEKTTDNFNNTRILGSGGQGTVYKGMLVDGTIVAVKKSKKVNEQHLGQFINEVIILSQINHRNVVKLFGCCLETKVPLLVYEFIPNGTLYQHIHHPSEDFHMTWKVRFQIAVECAGAIAYLHSSCSSPIYHRDIKSSNILLDEKYRAKISDFGTSRSISIEKTHVTTCVQGTFGYLDPEFFRSSQFSEKSDVYSFGVVLLELLTSKKPIFITDMPNEPRSLATTFVQLMETNPNELHSMVDAQVLQQCSEEEIEALAKLIERCLSLSGKQRPTMREVSITLEMIKAQHGIEGNPTNNEGIREEGNAWNEICITNEDLSNDTSTYNDNSYFVNSQPLSFDCT